MINQYKAKRLNEEFDTLPTIPMTVKTWKIKQFNQWLVCFSKNNSDYPFIFIKYKLQQTIFQLPHKTDFPLISIQCLI